MDIDIKDKTLVRELTQTGRTARATKAALIAERWFNTPRSDLSQLAVRDCARNGGLAAAVILQLYDQHGSVVAIKYAKKISQYGRTNQG